MKKLLYILLLVAATTTAQTNLSTYGAVGNGVTDDTAALRAAFDAGTNLISDPGKTYLISGTLYLNKNLIQTIDFNGSTITRNTTVHFMIDIDKRGYDNTLTTLKNLVLDGNNNGGSGIDISSRVHLQNVEIKNIIYNNANGVRLLIYNLPGCYGQSVFDNVDIHDIKPVGNDGIFGNDLGAAHGFIASAQQIPSQTTQIVYKNSSLHSIWGEDAGGISIFSSGLDISYSDLSYWFENISVADAQRRAVKNFSGNTTWVDCTFTSALANDPNIVNTMPSAGLFVFAAGSSATGAKNNVICGSTFQGHPSDPFNSYYTEVLIVGDTGNVGAEFRNCTFTGNHTPTNNNGVTAYANNGNSIQYLSFANCTFGTTKKVRILRNTLDYTYISTDNTYVDGKATVMSPTTGSYTEPTIAYADCPTIGGIITDPDPPAGILSGLKFSETSDRIIYFNEGITNPAATLSPTTTETGQTHTYEIVPRAGNDDSSKFRIVSGQLVLNNGSSFTPDYENPLDYNANNIYACDVRVTASPSGSTYTEDMVFYISNVVDEGGEIAASSIALSGGDQTVNIGIPIDLSVIFNGGVTTPTNTGKYYISANTDILTDAGVPIGSGRTTMRVVADDTTNGTIEDTMIVNVNGGNAAGKKRFLRIR